MCVCLDSQEITGLFNQKQSLQRYGCGRNVTCVETTHLCYGCIDFTLQVHPTEWQVGSGSHFDLTHQVLPWDLGHHLFRLQGIIFLRYLNIYTLCANYDPALVNCFLRPKGGISRD